MSVIPLYDSTMYCDGGENTPKITWRAQQDVWTHEGISYPLIIRIGYCKSK